jgi:hypothetical protein
MFMVPRLLNVDEWEKKLDYISSYLTVFQQGGTELSKTEPALKKPMHV